MHVDDQTKDIRWAVQKLREGAKVARAGWNGKGMFLYLSPGFTPGGDFVIHSHGFTTPSFRSFVAIKSVDGSCAPWVCSQTDLLATDWDLAL